MPSFDVETKSADTRYAWFHEHYGSRCWELDALNPVDLRAAVELNIRSFIDWDAWNHIGVVEAAECGSLAEILNNWRPAISGQDPK